MEPVYTRRSTLALIILGFIVTAVLLTLSLVKQNQSNRSTATAETTLSLVPDATSVSVGDIMTINVNVDTGANQIAAADLAIVYDKDLFEGVSFTAGLFLPAEFVPGTTQNGLAKIVVASPPTEPKQGQGTIAILKLRALKAGQTRIYFNPSTQVSAVGEQTNVARSLQSVDVAVTAQVELIPDSVIYTIPQNYNAVVGDQFYLPIVIDTHANRISGVDLTVTYDSSKLEAKSFIPGGFLPTVFTPGTISSGVAHIVLGSDVTDPRQGQGVLMTIQFKALSTGTAVVAIDPSSAVAGVGSSINLLKTRQSGTVTITNITAVNPSPSSTTCQDTRPDAPSYLQATVIDSHSVRLNWPQVTNATHYGVVYGTQPGVYIYGASNVGNVSSYTVGNLVFNTRYYFAVFANTECAVSGYSSEANAYPTGSVGGTNISHTTPTPRTTPQSTTQAVASGQNYQLPSATPVASFQPIDPNSNNPFTSISPKLNLEGLASPSSSTSGKLGFNISGLLSLIPMSILIPMLLGLLLVIGVAVYVYYSRRRDN